MSKFLIHIHSGPDLKNKATLGMLVAITAFKKAEKKVLECKEPPKPWYKPWHKPNKCPLKQ